MIPRLLPGGGRRSARRQRTLPPVPRLCQAIGGIAAFSRLRLLKLSATTLQKYVRFVSSFLAWAGLDKVKEANDAILDVDLCRYFDCLFEDSHHPFVARYTLFGLLCLFPRCRLPQAREALSAWVSRIPGASRFLVPAGLTWLFGSTLLAGSSPLLALAVALQLDAYLRPSEVIALDWASVARPAPDAGEGFGDKRAWWSETPCSDTVQKTRLSMKPWFLE